jgi:hypothetical protein
MKIAVACMWTDNIKEMGTICEENRLKYCQKHHYEWRCLYKTLDVSRHPVWSKLLWLMVLIQEQKYDWIQWTDADSIVANMDIRLEDIILETPDANFIATKDWWTGFNAGQFLIRSCDWSLRLLNRAYYYRIECLKHLFHEQEALRLELEQEEFYHPGIVAWIDKNKLNSYIHPGFGRHCAGHN